MAQCHISLLPYPERNSRILYKFMILSTLSLMVVYEKLTEEWLTLKRKETDTIMHTFIRFTGFCKWASAIFPFTLEIIFKYRLYLK